MEAAAPPAVRLALRGIGKRFAGTAALAEVDLDVSAGEVHALVGENGAGKSTLVRILGGLLRPDTGTLELGGRPCRIPHPAAAAALGIALVHQEQSLVPGLPVAENIFLGRAPRGRVPGLVDFRAMRRRAAALLESLDVRLPLDAPIARLGTGERQLVEIAKALSREPRLLILDEPTASLSPGESRRLVRLVRELRSRGTAVILVSHKLDEVFAAADRVSVLRDGRRVATRPTAEWNESELVRLMVGRDLPARAPRARAAAGPVALRVRDLSRRGRFQDVGFELRRGEVLGLAGLVGAGRSDLARALFGLAPPERGRVELADGPLTPRSPRHAMRRGMALVPEDRHLESIVPERSARENVSLAALARVSRAGWLRRAREREWVGTATARVGLAPHLLERPARALSGGNQQKLVLARWLLREPRVLMLDEPTRGIDVGARAEIHALVLRLAREGAAILLISSDLPELLALSDRILVMRAGRIAGELPGAGVDAGRGGPAA